MFSRTLLPALALLLLVAACGRSDAYKLTDGTPCFQKSTDNARSLFGEPEIEKLLTQIKDGCHMLSLSDQGIGDTRDRYIILNRLDFAYGMLRASETKAAKEIRKIRDEMDAKSNHQFSAMQDWKLGAAFRNQLAARNLTRDPNDAPDKPAPPTIDAELLAHEAVLSGAPYYWEDHFAIQKGGQLSFFVLPSGKLFSGRDQLKPYYINDDHHRSPVAYLCNSEDVTTGKACAKPMFPKPFKVINLEALQVKTPPGTRQSKYLLVSTEQYQRGRNTAQQPVKEPLYAIFDLAGNEVYRLPKIETSSGTYVFAMGINSDSPSALFGVGGLMDVCGGEEDYWTPATVKETLRWTPPDKLEKIDTRTPTAEVDKLKKEFGLQDHWFEYFKWPENRHGC